ncbi:MAG: lipid biosynthesis acyltransferase [Pedosphaera sp.]|nr:lipid biosynthesis acyltransferase [Pedosphaera sp.]
MTTDAKDVPIPRRPGGLTVRTIAAILFFCYASGLRLLSRLDDRTALRVSRIVNPWTKAPILGRFRRNLAILFPSPKWSPAQRAELEASYLKYMLRLRPEVARFFFRITPEAVRQKVKLSGREHLVAALEKDRGVLVIEGHFGNWNYTPAILASLGYSVTAVVHPNPIPGANFRSLHERAARNLGIRLGFVGQNAYASVKDTFAGNGILYLDFDVVPPGKRSRWFRLGDGAILLDTGPAILALRHRVPVLFANNVLGEDGTTVTLTPAVGAASNAAEDPSPAALLQTWVDTFQAVLLKDPGQWWAMSFVDLGSHSKLDSPTSSATSASSPS